MAKRKKPVRCINDLPFQQAEFVRQYLIDLDSSAAVIRAGYSEKGARQMAHILLHKPDVAKVILMEKERRNEESVRSEKEVLADIQSVGREARERGDLKSCLRALELEGKHYCMFTEKVQNEISGGLDIRWEE